MNASNELAAGEAGGVPQLSEDLEAAAGFSSLEKARQILVFQTIQEAISAVPPRLEASFPRVVAAYTTLSQVVEAASAGHLSDDHLARLEAEIEAAGGVIAPGLWSQGDHSIAAFRAATFGSLRRNFRPPVVEAACAALNARLQTLKLNDLGRVFQVIASFFSPLTPTGSNTARLQVFDGLDTDRQVLVFRTIQDAILSSPPRTEASFGSVVAAFQAEVDLLRCAAEGQLSDEPLAQLEAGIDAAGGLLAPGTYSQGKQSVASFRSETFKALQPLLPADVLAAAIAALNARLRDLRPASLGELFKAVRSFFMPLLATGWNSPTLQAFKGLDPQRQTLVFHTIEQAIAGHPELETTIFASAVKAVGAEQSVIQAAAAGNLGLAQLQQLRAAIDDCGGVIAPGLRASGEGSVAEFADSSFVALNRDLPPEVSQAATAALNAKLRTMPVSTFDDVVRISGSFLEPLMSAMLHAPAMPASRTAEHLPPAEPTLIEEVTLVPPLERELPDQPQDQPGATAVTPAWTDPVVAIPDDGPAPQVEASQPPTSGTAEEPHLPVTTMLTSESVVQNPMADPDDSKKDRPPFRL
jgi:hypothetical protein